MDEILCFRGYTVSRGGDWYEVSYRDGGETKTEICENFYEALRFIKGMTANDWFSRIFPGYEEEAV
jgi:hypothetical protein